MLERRLGRGICEKVDAILGIRIELERQFMETVDLRADRGSGPERPQFIKIARSAERLLNAANGRIASFQPADFGKEAKVFIRGKFEQAGITAGKLAEPCRAAAHARLQRIFNSEPVLLDD